MTFLITQYFILLVTENQLYIWISLLSFKYLVIKSLTVIIEFMHNIMRHVKNKQQPHIYVHTYKFKIGTLLRKEQEIK